MWWENGRMHEGRVAQGFSALNVRGYQYPVQALMTHYALLLNKNSNRVFRWTALKLCLSCIRSITAYLRICPKVETLIHLALAPTRRP